MHTHKNLSKDSGINNVHKGTKVALHFNTTFILLHNTLKITETGDDYDGFTSIHISHGDLHISCAYPE